jgi:hypothetical protein
MCMVCSAGAALGQAPVISNVQALHVGKGFVRVYWETSEVLSPAFATTLLSALNPTGIGAQDILTVADGSRFRAGHVLKIGPEYMLVQAVNGTQITVSRGYDFPRNQFSVYTGSLRSITVNGNLATAATNAPHGYQTGQRIQVTNSLGYKLDNIYTIAVSGPTAFTFPVSGVAAGEYANAALGVRPVPEPHAAGSVVNLAGNDSTVCYGLTTAYGSEERITGTGFIQTYAHYVALAGLQAGTTYHFRVMSTPVGFGPSNCSSPGPNTAVSGDFTVTTLPNPPGSSDPARPADIVNFDTSMPPITGTRRTVSANCSDLQDAIDAAAAQDGNLTHEIRIPAGAECFGNWILTRKNGPNPNGSGWIVIRTAASDDRLPPEGVRLRGAWYQNAMPRLVSPFVNGRFDAVFRMANAAHHYRLVGLEITTDPARASASPVILVNGMSDAPVDFLDPANQSSYLIVDRSYLHGQDNNSVFMGVRFGCNYCAVIDSEVTNIVTRAGDGGAVQIDHAEGPIRIVNNLLEGSAIGGFFASDNSSLIGKDVSDVLFQRNHVTKNRAWKMNAPEFASQVVLPVTAEPSNPARFTTARDFEFATNDTVTFAGGEGAWAALNAREWLASRGEILAISAQAGVVTVTTSAPHLLQPGQRIRVNGMVRFECIALTGETVVTGVPTPTTFTYSTTAADVAYCNSADAQVITVFRATRLDARTFTIPVDASGWGAPAGRLTVRYGVKRVVKNTFEIKAGRRFAIEGNIFERSFAQDQAGWMMAITPRAANYNGASYLRECAGCDNSIQDISVTNNLFQGGCTWFSVLGADELGPSDSLRRLKFANNLVTDINVYWRGIWTERSGATCYQTGGTLIGGYEDITLDHNTVVAGGILETYQPPGTLVSITNNIFRYGFRGITSSQNPGAGAWKTTILHGHRFERNVLWGDGCAFRQVSPDCTADPWGTQKQFYNGGIEGSQQEYNANFWPLQEHIGFAGALRIVGATNTSPISITVASPHHCATGDRVLIAGVAGNDAANDTWTVRVTGPATFDLLGSRGNGVYTGGNATALFLTGACANFRLAENSPFRAGRPTIPGVSGPASDGTDLGADIDRLEAAIGKVTLDQVIWNAASVEFRYTAPVGETCYVDVSSDGFASAPLRRADDPATRARQVIISGLTPASVRYQYRLLCRSFQFDGVSPADPPVQPPGGRRR